jgi:hypothetical protein
MSLYTTLAPRVGGTGGVPNKTGGGTGGVK